MIVRFIWKNGVVDSIDLQEGADALIIEGSDKEKKFTEEWYKNYLKGVHNPLPMSPAKTAFTQAVMDEICKVPFGTTITYTELAARVGNKRAIRAVGAACGRNHLPLLVPCHRILAKDFSLCGFNKGLIIKKELLELENALCHNSRRASVRNT
ncbi:MAG: methylated-DNA--[protein]-cysteine S-methyltransferase [Verrucomicrobia bacterium]|nr:methylated-DNA--[protein]-cysteine S-methyltransferase [Verrucomicrobiota bacterium]MBS0637481.1 methylated-DNA--[protein]-cysteine S-methyltransferase [Verrucomicrobiota bacterium]